MTGPRINGTVMQAEVACPMCGTINALPFDFNQPSRRQIASCDGMVPDGENKASGGCGEEFAYHVSIAITSHTAALGEWRSGPTVVRGDVDEVEDEDDRKAAEALRDRLSRMPVKTKEGGFSSGSGVSEGEAVGGEAVSRKTGEEDKDDDKDEEKEGARWSGQGDPRRMNNSKPPLIARRGRVL